MRYSDLSEAITGFPLDRVVVFDTETTGKDPYGGDEVLSIAICDAYGNILFSSLVRPTRHSSWPDAQQVNGISPRDVRDAPTIGQITPEIRDHLLGNKLVVGYNVSFDIQMLHSAGVFEEWPGATFDVMREFATVHGTRRAPYGDPGYAWSSLTDCARQYGYRFNAHDGREDAKATAYCYRALLCDEKYLPGRIDAVLSRIRRVGVGQTKATTSNVEALVDSGMTSSIKAELRLGTTTRGANAGSPRYECFVGDRCVGVQGSGQLDDIRALYSLSDDDPLPKSIPCKALLSMTGKAARCSVKITARGKLREDMMGAARNDRLVLGIPDNPAKIATIATVAKTSGPVEAGNVPHDRQIPTHSKDALQKAPRKKTGLAFKIAAVFLALLGLSGMLGRNTGEAYLAPILIGAGVFLWVKGSRR